VFEQGVISGATIWRVAIAVVPIDIKEDFASGRSAMVDASKISSRSVPRPMANGCRPSRWRSLFRAWARRRTADLTKTSTPTNATPSVARREWIAYNSDATARTSFMCAHRTAKANRPS